MLFLFEKYFKKKSKVRGFLLPEAILSLFILSTGITAVVGLISGSLRDSMQSRDVITATLLAQEGAELVRNIRDTNFVKSPSTVFQNFSTTIKNCRIKNFPPTLECSSSPSESYFRLDTDGYGLFNVVTGQDTKFHRYIYINFTNILAGSESAIVRSFVYWGAGESGMFTATTSSGSTANCTISKKCVYTEITLNNWRVSP